MKRVFIILLVNFICVNLTSIEVSGSQSGTWSSENNPYLMIEDIDIPTDNELLIEEGVEVIVQGDFQFLVQGVLIINGSEENFVTFQSENGGINWSGIRFENELLQSNLNYCEIKNAEDGINSINSTMQIINCSFIENQKAIHIFGLSVENDPEIVIESCYIENCQQNGIYITEHTNITINNCEITQCALDLSPRAAIMLSSQGDICEPVISNNFIHHNTWQGISAWDVTGGENIDAIISYNEISYNLTGIYLYFAHGTVNENFIHHNFESGNPNSGAGIMIAGSSANGKFSGNEITGNFTAVYITDGATANFGNLNNFDFDDDGENIFHENIDESNNTWSIYNASTQNILAENNTWDSENPEIIEQTVFDGNDNPGFGMVDFTPIFIPSEAEDEIAFANTFDYKLSNFPNPFNPITTIHFEVTYFPTEAEIAVYNIKGQIIRKFEINNMETGMNKIIWDGTDFNRNPVSSGIYQYRLIIDGKTIDCRKCLLLK